MGGRVAEELSMSRNELSMCVFLTRLLSIRARQRNERRVIRSEARDVDRPGDGEGLYPHLTGLFDQSSS